MPEPATEFNSNADYVARGLGTEAIAALRSHERMDELQFRQMTQQHEELKDLISGAKAELSGEINSVRSEMKHGFRSYDNKFWTLAIAMISLLLTVSGMLLWKVLFPH